MIWDMPVPSAALARDNQVTLNFDLIKQRAADKLEVPPTTVTNKQLADLFGTSKKTIDRYKAGRGARLGVAVAISQILGLPVEEITQKSTRGIA